MLPNASSNKHNAIFPNRIKFPFHLKSNSTFYISADYGIPLNSIFYTLQKPQILPLFLLTEPPKADMDNQKRLWLINNKGLKSF